MEYNKRNSQKITNYFFTSVTKRIKTTADHEVTDTKNVSNN